MDMLTPTSGTRSAHRNLKLGYFSQHHVDQLEMDVSLHSPKIIILVLSTKVAKSDFRFWLLCTVCCRFLQPKQKVPEDLPIFLSKVVIEDQE